MDGPSHSYEEVMDYEDGQAGPEYDAVTHVTHNTRAETASKIGAPGYVYTQNPVYKSNGLITQDQETCSEIAAEDEASKDASLPQNNKSVLQSKPVVSIEASVPSTGPETTGEEGDRNSMVMCLAYISSTAAQKQKIGGSFDFL